MKTIKVKVVVLSCLLLLGCSAYEPTEANSMWTCFTALEDSVEVCFTINEKFLSSYEIALETKIRNLTEDALEVNTKMLSLTIEGDSHYLIGNLDDVDLDSSTVTELDKFISLDENQAYQYQYMFPMSLKNESNGVLVIMRTYFSENRVIDDEGELLVFETEIKFNALE